MISAPTVTFYPCCDPGESIIFMDTLTALYINLVSGAVYRYTGPPATGQAQGPSGIDSLVSGQCYTLVFGLSPSIYPLLPTSTVYTMFFGTGNSCLNQTCVDACGDVPPDPINNRYLQFVPCCPESGPTLYFGSPGINVPINGVASYVGIINSNPYPTTDINCNITTSLESNKCYSITLHSVGVGQPVSNMTQYNCLTVAPENISGNYIYYSSIIPPYDSNCLNYIDDCPECNALCFTLWSCDGSQPLFTTSTDLTAFIGQHIIVSSLDPEDNIVDVCVFVQNTTQFDCTNAIEVVYDVLDPLCDCDCTCYTVTGNIKRIEYIDCSGNYVLIPNPGISTSNFCSQSYPVVFVGDATTPLIISNNGDCIETTFFDPETCEEITEYICTPPPCYLLQECFNPSNFIYSNSPSLALPANLGQVVTILGHTECWEILIPEECICPINVTVLTVSECCEACLPNINYKLTLCEDSTTFSYTSDDLSLYVDRVIRREDCPEKCWLVSEIDGNIPSDTPVVVIEDYLDCELCYRKYYLLEDCLGLELDIITYTDLSSYVDKIITLDWCPETCWTVTETIRDGGAGVISDVLNSYTECIDCLTNAPCICSTIKNYNNIAITYKYLDCEGILQTLTLLPGKKSKRLCLIRWYAPEPCDELIVTITSSVGVVSNIIVYQNSVNHPGPVIVNNKPTWKDAGNNLYIYYDGTKWILSKNFTPLVLPPVYTTIGFINCNGDCDCPTGTWQQSSSIPNQDVYVTTEFKYTIEYFGNCTNGRCPAVKNKQKVIKPGYKTCACETWKYEEVSCKAAESLYKQVLQLRYGISNCCPEDDERYIVQKELIDLQCIIPPIEETPNCFFGLVLETIYLMDYSDIALLPLEWQNIGLGDPTATCGLGVGCHTCDNALFELEADSVSLGESKMNNAGGDITTGSTTSYGTVICGDYDNTPGFLTGGSWTGNPLSRYSRVVVDEDIAQALADATSGGLITISAKCSKQLYNCTAPSCSCESGFDGGCHTNVTFLRVTQGNILLYAGGIGNDLEVTIDPCSPVPIPPLPPLVINTIYTTFSAFPPIVSYDCFNGVCSDPGDGSGVYPTLLACDDACTFPPPNISYNCFNGDCTDPGDGSGVYPTLLDCRNFCTDPPQVSYNCFRGDCTDPGDGSGVYPTLSACEEVCVSPPPPTPPCAPCTTAGLLPQVGNSVTYNGVVISATGTGFIDLFTGSSFRGVTCQLPMPFCATNTVRLGAISILVSQPFTYILTFSVPVNNIVIRIYSYNATNPPMTPYAESFTFTTNTGSGIPGISSCEFCCGTINGNTITAGNTESPLCDSTLPPYTSPYSTGNGIFTISNSSPFTTLTVVGPGGLAGSLMDICTDSVIPAPCAPCTTAGRLPQVGNSVTHNSVVISASGSGTIGITTGGMLGPLCPLPSPASTMSTVTFGSSGSGAIFTLQPFIYTLTFSVPVNNIVIRLYAYQASNPIIPPPIPSFIYPFAESFTFTTNTGSGLPGISSCQYCCGVISGNTITAANTSLLCDQYSSGFLTVGNGIFTISNSVPFTTLTVAGPGGLDGTIMDICTDSLIPVPPPVFSYNCVNGNCVFVSGPSGTYPTLDACTNACIPVPVTTYNCTNGNCVPVSGSGGEYPTLLLCQNNCGSANTIYTTFDII